MPGAFPVSENSSADNTGKAPTFVKLVFLEWELRDKQ